MMRAQRILIALTVANANACILVGSAASHGGTGHRAGPARPRVGDGRHPGGVRAEIKVLPVQLPRCLSARLGIWSPCCSACSTLTMAVTSNCRQVLENLRQEHLTFTD